MKKIPWLFAAIRHLYYYQSPTRTWIVAIPLFFYFSNSIWILKLYAFSMPKLPSSYDRRNQLLLLCSNSCFFISFGLGPWLQIQVFSSIIYSSMFDWIASVFKDQEPAKKDQKKKKKQQAPKKQKQPKQPQVEEWKYDYTVQFLNSKLWICSLLEFVDNNCIVFDNEQVNKFQYTKIHNEFKQISGNLIGMMMEDASINDEELEAILCKGFESKTHKKIFNQLILIDDFQQFKKSMLKRNMDQNQQAIKIMESNSKVRPSVSQVPADAIMENQEEEMLKRALEESKKQAQRQMISRLEENVSKKEQTVHQKESIQKEETTKQKIQSAKQNISEKVQPSSPVKRSSKLQPIGVKKELPSLRSDLPPLKNDKLLPRKSKPIENNNQFFDDQKQKAEIVDKKQQPQKEQPKQQPKKEVQKPVQQKQTSEQRKRRLLEQRQKMRKIKQQQRMKAFNTQNERKVDQIFLQDDGFHDVKKKDFDQTAPKVSEEQLNRRKELMKKFKNRIIQDDF